MRNFIYSLMTDKRPGAIADIFKGALYILSLAYGFALFCRALFYKYGIFNTRKVPIGIISVGNITLGGTGKTPFVIKLSEILRDEMKKEAPILIRGYGWDEQAMLKKRLPDIPILVGEDRVKSARRAIKLYGSTAAVLDDGFQYWELHRDLDIVLIDSGNPFGNGCLFPRGVLREPKESLRRAHIAVLTKIDRKGADLDKLKKDLKNINQRLVFMETAHRPVCFYDARLKRFDLSYADSKKVILLSSIGDPGYFAETVKGLKANIVEHLVFADHHNYTENDCSYIMKKCRERSFDMIITTEKDAVKLNRMRLSFGSYTLLALAIDIEIISGKELLIDRLHSLYSR